MRSSVTKDELAIWTNGNVRISLFRDGTKVRDWVGRADPDFPESVDLKITDYCEIGCSYCHESSTVKGQHAEFQEVARLTSQLPAGCELAIGGGNPLAFQGLFGLLKLLQHRGQIPSLTVNSAHLPRYGGQVYGWLEALNIWGLGVSYRPEFMQHITEAMAKPRTVLHVIAGVQTIDEVLALPKEWQLLVLGYKAFGRGLPAGPLTTSSLSRWRYFTGHLLRRGRVSFDTLALTQLGVRNWLTSAQWDELFMGEDGQFSMYLDVVTKQFAPNSYSMTKLPVGGRSTFDMFAALKRART